MYTRGDSDEKERAGFQLRLPLAGSAKKQNFTLRVGRKSLCGAGTCLVLAISLC